MARKKTKPDARTIDLRSGGTVTIELDYSAFDLTDTDRDFVAQVVELFQSYGAKSSTNTSSASPADAKKKTKARRGEGDSNEGAEAEAATT